MGKQKHIDKILSNTAAFSQAFINADYEALSQSYTEDDRILPSGPAIVQGRAAIKERWILPEGFTTLHHEITPEEIKIIACFTTHFFLPLSSYAQRKNQRWLVNIQPKQDQISF